MKNFPSHNSFVTSILGLAIIFAGCSAHRQTIQSSDEFFRPLSSAEIQKLHRKGKDQKVAKSAATKRNAEGDSLREVITRLEKGLLVAQRDNFELRLKIANATIDSASQAQRNLAVLPEYQSRQPVTSDHLLLPGRESLNSKTSEGNLAARSPNSVSLASASKQLLTPPAQYQQALSLFNQKRYKESIQVLEHVQNVTMDRDLSMHSKYWIGENYFGLGDYAKALKQFELVESSGLLIKQVDACWMVGRCHEQMHEYAMARKCFDRIIREFATHRLAQAAKKKLGSPLYRTPSFGKSSTQTTV